MERTQKIVAVDLDGTLNLGRYSGQLGEERPNKKAIEMLNVMALANKIIIYTARHADLREVTERWLEVNDVQYTELVMDKLKYDVLIDDKSFPAVEDALDDPRMDKEIGLFLSGGLDSTVLLYECASHNLDVQAYFWDYGQNSSATCLKHIRTHYNRLYPNKRLRVIRGEFKGHAGSRTLSPTDFDQPCPYNNKHVKNWTGDSQKSRFNNGYIQGRNLRMLQDVIAYAVEMDSISHFLMGHQTEVDIEPQNVIRDTTQEFIEAFVEVAEYSYSLPVSIELPFIDDSKRDILNRYQSLDMTKPTLAALFDSTYSCFYGPTPCEECLGCTQRAALTEL